MKEKILKELELAGIKAEGCYAKLPEIMETHISNIKELGINYFNETNSLGSTTKKIVLKLALEL